jgi:hypothetical protein
VLNLRVEHEEWKRESKWGRKRRDDGGDLSNVQCKTVRSCHNDSPLYNIYILIKKLKPKEKGKVKAALVCGFRCNWTDQLSY